MTAPVDRIYRNSVGGCFVTTVDEYWRLGGMDERFDRRWGYEDNAFHNVVTTLSTEHRIPGILFSFNHHADREMTHDNPNRHRADLYRFAAGTPQLIKELIKR
jgi:predicted glycosyltransferase involved in capsule biosynthesis